MKQWLRSLLIRLVKLLQPKTNPAEENRYLKQALDQLITEQLRELREKEQWERVGEMIEARQMAGSGPWKVSGALLAETDNLIKLAASRIESGGGMKLREAGPDSSGTFSDYAFLLDNIE